jgi:hypothetical protein
MAQSDGLLDPPITYAPVGHCIYCPDAGENGLGNEHIIPFALNGTQVLPRASCDKCGGVTSYLDGVAARSVFYQLRSSAGLRTRSQLPDGFPVILKFEGGREERSMVPADIHSSTVTVPKFALPSLLSGKKSDGNYHLTYTTFMRTSQAFDQFVKAKGAVSSGVESSIKPQQYARFLAKIAHAFAVAKLGAHGFSPLLLDLIHGRNVLCGPELIGSEPTTPPPVGGLMHELGLVNHHRYVVVRIRLFASAQADWVSMPVYLAVAGIKGSLGSMFD